MKQTPTEVPCILCGKPLITDSHGEGIYGDVKGGASAVFDAGYGSRHDMNAYSLVICDDCIQKSYLEGRLKFIKDHDDSRLMKPVWAMTDSERKALGFRTDAEIKAEEEEANSETSGVQILEAIATEATEGDSVPYPDTPSGEAWAAWYKQQYGPIVESEKIVRVTLAKMLHCPATWEHILPAVESLICK